MNPSPKPPSLALDDLLDRNVWPHPTTNIEVIETHISWVILTGQFAYKVKKPIDLGFVNYVSLERRKHFCDLEVELNRRFAPDLYLGVVPIWETSNGIKAGQVNEATPPGGLVVEYAVKMRQFRQSEIAACHLADSEIPASMVEAFGKSLSDFHSTIESAIPTLSTVQPACVAGDAMDNFTVLNDFFGTDVRSDLLARLKAWTEEEISQLSSTFERRLWQGKVKRCHGDLHLKNIICLPNQLQAFDGIEFNAQLQLIDVLSELAFPVMDFCARGRADLGWRLMNAYLESTGDYLDLRVLRFYLVYRALVRAKVTTLTPANSSETERKKHATGKTEYARKAGTWDKYLDTASYFAFSLKPKLVITHGFSGSGKSTTAIQQIDQQGGIRIRSDSERHRLASRFRIKNQYAPEMTDWIYRHLLDSAKSCLSSGFPVYVDATFLKFDQRNPFQELSESMSVDFEILDCDADYEELCRRIRERKDDPSEANQNILDRQMKFHEPLTTDELQYTRRASAD